MAEVFRMEQEKRTDGPMAIHGITLIGEPTVGEFIVQILEQADNAGAVSIYEEDDPRMLGMADYEKSYINNVNIAQYMDRKVKKAYANGGSGLMDYVIKL